MENYIITEDEKKQYIEKYPVLACLKSFGIDYNGYTSIKCTVFIGTCTYANSKKSEYLNCKQLHSKS